MQRGKIVIPSPTIGGQSFDCWVSESHNLSIEVTSNPVEGGGVVSDHAYNNPRTINVKVGASNFGGAIAGQNNVGAALDYLQGVMYGYTPISVTTLVGGVYNNMLIKSINYAASSTPHAVVFDLSLVELIITTTKQVQLAYTPADVKQQIKTAQQKNKGQQQGNNLSKDNNSGSAAQRSQSANKTNAAKKAKDKISGFKDGAAAVGVSL